MQLTCFYDSRTMQKFKTLGVFFGQLYKTGHKYTAIFWEALSTIPSSNCVVKMRFCLK